MDAGGYGFVSARMRGKALRNDPIYKEAYWPVAVRVSQLLTHESFTTLDLAEDFRLGLRLARSPLRRRICHCVSCLFVSRKGTRRRRLPLNSNHRRQLPLRYRLQPRQAEPP